MKKCNMGEVSGFVLVPTFAILFLSFAAQAAAPVSPPGSRFVWEPGDNLTFTWTTENFGWFYYDAKSGAGKESLTIKLDKINDRSIPKDGIEYSTTVETVTARYSPFGEYAVIGFGGEKFLAGYPAGRSKISNRSEISLKSLHRILKDENAIHKLVKGSSLPLGDGYLLMVTDMNISGNSVMLSLFKYEDWVDTKFIDAGKNYVYEISDGSVIAAHIDSVFEENETASVNIIGIFQVSYKYPVNEGDIFGRMKITEVSDSGIKMSNFLPIDLKRGSNIDIGGFELKVADSNTLRLHLTSDRYEKHEHRGAAGSKNLTAWDGLNYAGFLYDADSGNYSESLVITKLNGRRIPEGGLTYTSYIRRVPYAVTKVTGEIIPGTDGSYVSFRLGEIKYTARNNGFAELLIAHGDSRNEKKLLVIRPSWFKEDDEQPPGWSVNRAWEPGMETWELGEGYALTVKSLEFMPDPRKAQLVLSRNGVELDDIWLSSGSSYRYFQPEETGNPKLITYLDAVFAGTTVDPIQLRYTWFVSDNITQIKEGDRFGVFNVTVVDPDQIVLKNRVPIDLKAGSSINLLGNLSFFVENSDELMFYPTNAGGSQVMSEDVTVNGTLNITDKTSPVADKTGRIPGFEAVISLPALVAVYLIKGREHE